MKKIAFFCIPAHGHTNPMLPVAAELVKRGNAVRFYSFNEFKEKIAATGAEFVSCDAFLPKLSRQEEAGLKKVSTTEMTVQDIRITLGICAWTPHCPVVQRKCRPSSAAGQCDRNHV